jgi:RHS repeat-associated protein
LGYAGGYTDPTGLIYLINRYYDPATGQFLSLDPYLNSTRQPYIYADGNPVTFTDPVGLMRVPAGSVGNVPRIHCNQKMSSRNTDGVMTLAHYCPGRTMPWGYLINPSFYRNIAGGVVYEGGLIYTVNWGSIQKNAPHPDEPEWYNFHGNMSSVGINSYVDFADEIQFFTWGGTGAIFIYGEVQAVQ